MGRRLSDPSWKSGPVESKPTASEHAIAPEDFGHSKADWDGFSVDEDEHTDGEPLVALQESVECRRDGCDASHTRRLLFTTNTLSDAEKHALDIASGSDTVAELVTFEGERVGPDTISVNGIKITPETKMENPPSGECYGRAEPSPNVDAHRYDL